MNVGNIQEHSMEYCSSHITLLWIKIMLCMLRTNVILGFHERALNLVWSGHECSWLLHSKTSHWSRRMKTVQVHFTLEGEDLRVQKIYIIMHMKSTWIPTWILIYNVSWFAKICVFVLDPPTKGRPKANSNRPCQWINWYNLWMRVKGPHNYMVITLDSYVKWP